MKQMVLHPHKVINPDGTEGLVNSMVEVDVPDPDEMPSGDFATDTKTPPSNTFGTGA